jgi:hypothetical protein
MARKAFGCPYELHRPAEAPKPVHPVIFFTD